MMSRQKSQLLFWLVFWMFIVLAVVAYPGMANDNPWLTEYDESELVGTVLKPTFCESHPGLYKTLAVTSQPLRVAFKRCEAIGQASMPIQPFINLLAGISQLAIPWLLAFAPRVTVVP